MDMIKVYCDSCKGRYEIPNKHYKELDVIKFPICGCLDRAVRAINESRTMNVEKAIKIIQAYINCKGSSVMIGDFDINEFNEIISLLHKLDKFELMWEDMINKLSYIEQMNFPMHKYTYEEIMSIIKEIKQKYFPEPVKRYITIEVESEKESEVDDGMEDIKELVDNMSCPKMRICDSW